MGTRASFFVGDPRDTEKRKWLGCIAWDGYPEGDLAQLINAGNAEAFADLVSELSHKRDDFCDPTKHGFPFPWADDLFLTDYTYAWFDDAAQVTCFHHGFVPLREYIGYNDAAQEAYSIKELLPHDTPAPAQWDRSAPDSIIYISALG